MLWSTLQGITRDGKGVQLAPYATNALDEQKALLRTIRDAGGVHKDADYAEVIILSNRGVLVSARCTKLVLDKQPEPEPETKKAGKK